MKPSERIKEIFETLYLETDWSKYDSEKSQTKQEIMMHLSSIIQYLDEKHDKLHSAPLLVTEQVGLESTGRREEIREKLRKVLG